MFTEEHKWRGDAADELFRELARLAVRCVPVSIRAPISFPGLLDRPTAAVKGCGRGSQHVPHVNSLRTTRAAANHGRPFPLQNLVTGCARGPAQGPTAKPTPNGRLASTQAVLFMLTGNGQDRYKRLSALLLGSPICVISSRATGCCIFRVPSPVLIA